MIQCSVYGTTYSRSTYGCPRHRSSWITSNSTHNSSYRCTSYSTLSGLVSNISPIDVIS